MSDYAVINPATGKTEATYATATDAEIETAVAAADAAHRGWSRSSTVAERAALVRRMAELHRERREELADVFVREMGKPREAALGEVDFAADIAEYYADQAEAIMKDQPLDILGDGTAIIRRSSLGPLVGIMPWNFPAYQIVRFAAPNLIVGNTILLKPAPQCPESSSAIAAIYRDAGFPEGAYQNVLATNEQIAAMIADPRVQGVSLTGSERAGAAVAEVAGRNLKKVALELGGSDPFIVLSTDDLDATVQAGIDARLDNNGQACNGAKRFIIVDGLYDAFVEKFVAGMAAVAPTDPMQEDTVLGPVSSLAAAENLKKQIDTAVAQGATLLTGGDHDGAFFEPTVLADVTPEMDVYAQELFGPAAVVYRVADEDAAVALANDTTFGLGSYVFTTDAAQAERVADKIEAGMVYVNLVLADSPELPFGGIKRSGTSRELGHLAAEEFVNKKLIRVG
ncbi:succinate-semialdehyde dehydrogenase/glutarate-semialdehyde dehydrogenase [Microbacterium keratanolyticum]|uniref:Succinate-semialdehyde dehydrogenase n=1 Tax=Microbacterium keratanolyticum TaxID=67574 RepID=A0A9W6MA07_9MICO|nr:NAD-dependent succinate-semialdehyde dehydrogenase [Microbacterium keratanolyticum]MBM7468166.1 succinate-semialdehyde dehydrogenase/glutarate-semialdehyde dehydrogenase [Microbacterium keratanolyticum]GLK03157.1 succinate-semialdehyde dehydrogenase [Microbacterium keratanolyticum]